jgi:hypothetical protein
MGKNLPKYKSGDRVLYCVYYHNDIAGETIEVIIATFDQYLEKDNCWLYRAISTITNQIVFVKESDLLEQKKGGL